MSIRSVVVSEHLLKLGLEYVIEQDLLFFSPLILVTFPFLSGHCSETDLLISQCVIELCLFAMRAHQNRFLHLLKHVCFLRGPHTLYLAQADDTERGLRSRLPNFTPNSDSLFSRLCELGAKFSNGSVYSEVLRNY